MGGFVKLYGTILTSSVWVESHETFRVWMAMLVLADRNGYVAGTAPGLANIARVTLEECEAALTVLLSPDKHSRTKEHEGRRIEVADGGWNILNHSKYREMRSESQIATAERVKRHRMKAKRTVTDVTGNDVTHHSSEGRDQKTETTTTRSAPTWLTHVCDVYERHYGAGSFPYGQAGKTLKPLHDAGHSGEEIASRMNRYCERLDDIKYFSLAKFRQTFGAYAAGAVQKSVGRGGVAQQTYDAGRAALGLGDD